jgi:hypothetical protein
MTQEVKIEVGVIYNGVSKVLEVQPHSRVEGLLHRALTEFGIRDRPHAYALYTMTGAEIPNDQSIEAAGIKDKAELFLREKIVGGG